MEVEAGGSNSGRRTHRATVDACAGLSGEGDDEAPLSWGSASFGAERRAQVEGNGIAARRHTSDHTTRLPKPTIRVRIA
jgi:hypothetical protein